jgi:hypothetical protein
MKGNRTDEVGQVTLIRRAKRIIGLLHGTLETIRRKAYGTNALLIERPM